MMEAISFWRPGMRSRMGTGFSLRMMSMGQSMGLGSEIGDWGLVIGDSGKGRGRGGGRLVGGFGVCDWGIRLRREIVNPEVKAEMLKTETRKWRGRMWARRIMWGSGLQICARRSGRGRWLRLGGVFCGAALWEGSWSSRTPHGCRIFPLPAVPHAPPTCRRTE